MGTSRDDYNFTNHKKLKCSQGYHMVHSSNQTQSSQFLETLKTVSSDLSVEIKNIGAYEFTHFFKLNEIFFE
jgi:hypothetical protein